MKPVCLVIGAGAGIGGNVAKRFAREGYHACLCRRSDAQGLEEMVTSIRDNGGLATGFILNAVEPNSIEDRVAHIEANIGPIDTVIYNLGAQIGSVPLSNLSYEQFEMGWKLGTFGLFRLASTLFPLMEARGKGTLLVTSATAAVRGNSGQHSHAAAMGGRRMLCQTLNAEFSSKGIHVVHILIDGPEEFQNLRQTQGLEHDGLLLPEKISDTYFHLAQQHRSAWTHELDLRAYSDMAWWNNKTMLD